MDSSLTIDVTAGIPEDWVMLEAVVVAKCVDRDGDQRLCVRNTSGLAEWDSIGMLIAAGDAARETLKRTFTQPEDS